MQFKMSSSLNNLSIVLPRWMTKVWQKTSIGITAISQSMHCYRLNNHHKQNLLQSSIKMYSSSYSRRFSYERHQIIPHKIPWKIPVLNFANIKLSLIKNQYSLSCVRKQNFSSKSTSGNTTNANTDPLNRPIVYAMKLKKGTSNKANRKGQKMKIAKHRTKKPARLAKDTEGLGVVTAFSTAEEYNLEHLSLDLQAQGLFREAFMPQDAQDVLHMQVFEKSDDEDEEPREIFLFREGSVVFWNVPEQLIKGVIRTITKHQTHAYEIALVTWENEQMSYTYDRDVTRIANGDTIILHENNDPEKTVLEKFAFSNALSLSVKLAIWEWCLDQFVASIEWVPDNLKAGKKLKMSKEQVLRKLGELFSLRHRINLTSDLLISPDFYWNRDDLELLFTKTCNFLSIARRTKVLNEKLNHCSELVELMRTHLNEQHSFRLEWMIIALITVEVIFEIVHYIKMYVQEKGDHLQGEHYETKKAS
ncbi:required for meiotic nuclear division protein 1 homolog [Anneissia japonica]|uniref:required for meiotic nuclear division protein 1 homolog n=1 Tax=Anneissia japonica TaxID=1529436 RepID=UPI0014259067|nr:required for meiotic nuclear division protein 1 homolog [Anneissia japonica]